MYKIFYMDKCADGQTDSAIQRVLSNYFEMPNADILRTENGKPYIESNPLFLSVSHTKDKLFLVFADENVGIDAEQMQREVQFCHIVKKFPLEEREEITSIQSFLRHWTAKESVVKWLGGTLARDLYTLTFSNGVMRYREIPLPVHFAFLQLDECLLCLCAEHLQEEKIYIEKIVL